MERKLTILMRALLAVALVAITLVLTYEFSRAGNGQSSLDVQEIRLQASISRYPPQHKGHQARVRPTPLNVFANHILILFVKPTTVFLNHAQEIRLRPDCPNRKHGCPLTDERQISHGEA